jgi:hypothetical protein
MLPDLIIRIPSRRIRRLKIQFKKTVCRFNVLCNDLAAVYRMSIDNQNDWAAGPKHELLQELDEHLSIESAFGQHELQLAFTNDGGDHVGRSTLSRGP